jgi:hypothetical protein
MDAQILAAAKVLPDATKIEPFDGNNFKRWQQKVLAVLDFTKISSVLTEPRPDEESEEQSEELRNWEMANKLCVNTILNSLSNELFDVYCNFTIARDLWDELVGRYVIEDEGTKKFAASNFLHFQMTDEKSITSQIHEFHNIVAESAKEGDGLPESFMTQCLVEKLPDSWKEYKLHFKQKKTFMSLQQTIVHIKIEERNRSLEKVNKAKEIISKANLVEEKSSRPPQHYKKFDHKPKGKHWNNKKRFNTSHSLIQKKRVNCFICGKAGHYAAVCKQRTSNNNKGSISKNKANVTEVEEIIAAVVSEAHMTTEVKGWVIDSASTRHICGNKEDLSSYTPIKENTERVIVGDNRSVPVVGKGKALLKLTSGKTLSLSDVLHVPHFRHNLVSVHLLGKARLKVLFDGGIVTLTKHDVFIGKGYEDQGLFVLNVANTIFKKKKKKCC